MAKKNQPLLRSSRPTPTWRLLISTLVPFGLGLALVGATFGEQPDATGGLDPSEQPSAGLAPVESTETPERELDEGLLATEGGAEAGGTSGMEAAEAQSAVDDGTEDVTPTEAAPMAEEVAAVIHAEVAGRNGTPAPGTPEATVEIPVAATPTPSPIPSDTRFVRGRLAYLRCGSMASADGVCPRDRDLEASAWAAIEAANQCGLGSGSGDVRLHFAGGAPELRFRDFGDAPLSLGTLQACLVPHVTPLRSTLTEPFILSIRFQLR